MTKTLLSFSTGMSRRHQDGEPDGDQLELGHPLRLRLLQTDIFAGRQSS
jgi:hypothetical protein